MKPIRFNRSMARAIMYLKKAEAECSIGRGLEGVVLETLKKCEKHLKKSLVEGYHTDLKFLFNKPWSVIKEGLKLSKSPASKKVKRHKPSPHKELR